MFSSNKSWNVLITQLSVCRIFVKGDLLHLQKKIFCVLLTFLCLICLPNILELSLLTRVKYCECLNRNKRSCCTFHFTVWALKKNGEKNNFIFRSCSHDQSNLLLFAFITVWDVFKVTIFSILYICSKTLIFIV